MHIESFDLAEIPLYNYDIEQQGDPAPLRQLKETIARADGILVSTSEYQQCAPEVLKNALDWGRNVDLAEQASRDHGRQPRQDRLPRGPRVSSVKY